MKLQLFCVLTLALAALAACSSAEKKTAPPAQTQASTPAPVAHDASTSTSPDVVKTETCEEGKDKRSLEVLKTTKGCELSYTKWGKASVVSSSKHGLKHCEDSLDKITKKLEADKFKCG